VLVVFYSHTVVTTETSEAIYSSVDNVPYRKVALLLGTSPYVAGGTANSYFWNRVEAAASLLAAGKVSYILASGDNRHQSYNEPHAMREALLSVGVPADAIVPDYAGFSTLDSVLRTRRVFVQRSFTIVSQRFHVERALYIARHNGIDAVGYSAADVRGPTGVRTRVREYFARVKAVMDVHVLSREPEYLGDTIIIP
jgi:SanA protein